VEAHAYGCGVDERGRLADARVARLATVSADGRPHLVPVVFALLGDVVWSAVDAKPKSTRRLRRLANIEDTGRASLLVDAYEEDWSSLWWVRVDGPAQVLPADDVDAAVGLDALVAKYPQYRDHRPEGPVVAVRCETWRSWSASPEG
jgi:PPOX class probable F420-dependent enzyme